MNTAVVNLKSSESDQQAFVAKQTDNTQVADFNRQKLFAKQSNQTVQQPQEPENKNIGGITENTVVRILIDDGEIAPPPPPGTAVPLEPLPRTQADVVTKFYDALANKAGLEGEFKNQFVEERLSYNKSKNNGELKVYQDNTNETFSAGDWEKTQLNGSLNMSPTAMDIQVLKDFKSTLDCVKGE